MIAMLLGLPVIGPFLSAAAAVIQVAARICNAIPGAVWAVVLLVALWNWWGEHGALVDLRADHAALQDAVEAQKEQAAKLLAAKTAEAEAIQLKLANALALQEKTDEANKKTVADLRAEMRRNSRAAGGPGLRDPWVRPSAAGCGRGGGSAQPQDPAAAQDRAGDSGEATGILSQEFERLLLDQAEAADAINIAYIACRADALSLRATMEVLQLSPP